MQHSPTGSLTERVLLLLGYVSLIGAVVAAHSNPATGYELSLYSATPLLFWLTYGFAMFVALVVALRTSGDWLRRGALGLGGTATVVFVGLPILRGYRFYGGGDSLTHLGWMRGIGSGSFQPTELIYPGLHTSATLFSNTFGLKPSHALLLVTVVLSGVFCVFVTLSTSLVFESKYTTTVAAFSAFLFLPITSLSTFVFPHTMSQAIMMSSIALYLLLKYVRMGDDTRSLSSVGAALATTSIALVIYHPQLVAHLLTMFIAVSGLQFLFRRYRTEHPIASHRTVYAQSAFMIVAFLVWTSNHGFFTGVIESSITRAVDFFRGNGSAAASAASQGASLVEIGGSILEIFLKLFGVSLLFTGIAGLLFLYSFWEKDGQVTHKTDGVLTYFVGGLSGLGVIFALYFFGSVSEMYFRVFALMMVLVTIVGAAAISYVLTTLSSERSNETLHSVTVIGFAIVLVLSLFTVFPSTFIFLPSPHITDMSMSGHQSAFGYQQDGVGFDGIRSGPDRYADVERAEPGRARGFGSISGEEIEAGIAEQYSSPRYLTVTRVDREREAIAFEELRYSRSQLNSISAQPGVNRVQSNGDFELFYIRGASE